jgi:hypothetical protein
MGSVKAFKADHGYTVNRKPDEPDACCFHCEHVDVPRVLKPYHRCTQGDFITTPFNRCDLFQRKEA